jgi:uncharacterized membrane protein (UPF0127 family)
MKPRSLDADHNTIMELAAYLLVPAVVFPTLLLWQRRRLPARSAADALTRAINLSRDGKILGDRILWAGTPDSRRRGLLDRQALAAGEGVYLVPCSWIHMFGMRFAIDVAFLDDEGRVLAMCHGIRPNRMSRPVLRAQGALELPAGTLASSGTRVGDRILLEPADD